MRRRNKIIIAIVIILLILLALWLLWSRLFRVVPETIVVVPEDQLVADIEETGPVDMIEETEEPARAPAEVSVDSLARTFSERYASYSNESDFANLYDLEPLMTDSMWRDTEAMIESLEVQDVYHGVTSRAITITVPAMTDDDLEVTVEVLMQREDALGSPQNIEINYETLVLDLVKESGTWKVDSATWQ